MKKIFTYILTTITIAVIIASVFCVADFNNYYNSVANNPASDGIDFLMIGMGHGLAVFGLSLLGLVCSIVLRRISTSKFFKIYSVIGIVLFVLGLAGAVYLFYL